MEGQTPTVQMETLIFYTVNYLANNSVISKSKFERVFFELFCVLTKDNEFMLIVV